MKELTHEPADIEKELNVPPPPLNHIHPTRPLFEACNQLLETHARRLPLIDRDSTSEMELIVSVLTQYRVLKFVANNVGPFDSIPPLMFSDGLRYSAKKLPPSHILSDLPT
jgi:hypothetical protein